MPDGVRTSETNLMQANAGELEGLAQRDDSDLVGLARAGSHLAFRTLVERNNQRLYRVAKAVIDDEAEIDDVLQESLLRAYSGLKQFREDASFSTWVTRIVLNEAFGRLRKARGRPRLVPDSQSSDGHAPMWQTDSLDPEAAAALADVRRLLESAIACLPEPFRLVFIMRDIEEMRVEEVALSLEIKEETVKTRLHRARRLLRKTLNEKLGSALSDTFPFLGTRCMRTTESVMARIGTDRGGRGEVERPARARSVVRRFWTRVWRRE